jgi:glucose-6-phosphate 1-dehydrogenase
MDYERLKQPLVLVIFGITGDLSQRKLLPALYQLARAGELPEQLHIIGISRRSVAHDEVFGQLRSFVGETNYDPQIEQRLKDRTEMRQMDLLSEDDYRALLARLQEIESKEAIGGSRLYYLSIPSKAFTPIIRLLGDTGHNLPIGKGPDKPRLLVEKPFGYDLASAHELVEVLQTHFQEDQVYRIDHYVAKETVQNILVFRFQNPLFESIWNNRHIDHISAIAHEKIDIEGRANFYEQTGALRDLIQSHLLQLLAMTTMARPERLDSVNIHAEKLKLLQSIQPIAPDQVFNQTLRAQYEGYRAEVGNEDSVIETFARVNLWIDNEQWTGVPVTLETGKALDEKCTEIGICFRQPEDAAEEQNRLVFRIQPNEGITLRLQMKQPGIKNITDSADMDFEYERSFNQRPAEAYERVLVDAIRGDQTLFASSAEVIRSWEIIENVIEQWSRSAEGLKSYPKGSPASSETLKA